MMLEYIMREDDVSLIKGIVMIMDMAPMTVAHMTHMTPTYTKKILVVTTVKITYIIYLK